MERIQKAIPPSQLVPFHCGGHIHSYDPTVLLHVPLFKHGGDVVHSSTSRIWNTHFCDDKRKFIVCIFQVANILSVISTIMYIIHDLRYFIKALRGLGTMHRFLYCCYFLIPIRHEYKKSHLHHNWSHSTAEYTHIHTTPLCCYKCRHWHTEVMLCIRRHLRI